MMYRIPMEENFITKQLTSVEYKEKLAAVCFF